MALTGVDMMGMNHKSSLMIAIQKKHLRSLMPHLMVIVRAREMQLKKNFTTKPYLKLYRLQAVRLFYKMPTSWTYGAVEFINVSLITKGIYSVEYAKDYSLT